MRANPPAQVGQPVDASAIPVLETDRLRLRPFRLSDLDAASNMWADSNVVRFIGGSPRTPAEVWAASARSFGHWALLGYGFWVLADRQSDRYVGEMGLLEGLRNTVPSYSGTPEAGWALAADHWGKGYATEALAAVLRWSDAQLSCDSTVCIIEPAHHSSLRVAEKCGYKRAYETRLNDEPILVLERVRPA